MTTQRQRDTARETMRRNATKHGLASGETKSTYYVCKSVLRSPYTLVDPCWHDLAVFTRGVLCEIGPRSGPEWRLVAVVDLGYLLDPNGEPSKLLIFKPGCVRWQLK
ncbi:hypothetical protein G7072_04020 [Nocardioides sp. HDW12B]|uniref:hypothetical protein n=1 Tax=Nocardioides sp. HDW12B TaxID=2714939 RepID=UPI0014079535|nr:hypothetical protein [Nocardioides sp. HDW12B]QIK65613.1 hypothetical protein G7072_04020 [Nocardioides sp. HDW12B]